MKALVLSRRTAKEILRDPLNLAFGLGFPIVLLSLLTAIQRNIPEDLFRLEQLAPGICVFGLAFMSLFSATLISRDRASALLLRLYTTPLRSVDFILGYLLPMLPIALGQVAVSYGFALILGLPWRWTILPALALSLPISVIFLSIGLLCGSLLTDKQVGGVCGALLTNLTGWLSGIWFDLDLVGGAFRKFAELLPFYHAVKLERAAYAGDWDAVWAPLGLVCLWGAGLLALSIWAFLHQRKKN